MSLAEKFIPSDLPGQVKLLVKLLGDLDQSIRELRASLAPSKTVPDSDPTWRPLPVQMLGQRADIVTVIASGDTAGLYSIQVGSAVAFQFRMLANTTEVFEFPLGRHLGVSPNLKISLNVPTGATGEATIAYRVRSG